MYEIYKVLETDTLDMIAGKYGTTVGNLLEINGFDSNYQVRVNEQIVVPVKNNQVYQYYTVKKGDNLYDIARDNEVDYNLLVQLNGLDPGDYIYPNQTIVLPDKNVKIYLTKEDDTLEDVLRMLNVSVNKLMEENDKIYLRPEQILIFKEK